MEKYNGEQLNLTPANLEAEIQMLREELMNERDRNLRTLADFKNYRRRIELDGNKVAQEGKRRMMLALLDIIDDLEKAFQSASDLESPFVKGVQNIRQKILSLLETHDVFPFETVGKSFNHDMHEAVAMTPHDGTDPGIVIDEFRRGYLWQDELLRPAQVRVAG
jgi:molecular chaperone GrpE